MISAGAYFGYQYVQSSLQPVDASSKQYVTVQIPEGANVQTIGSTLEKSGLIKHGVIFAFYAKYKKLFRFEVWLLQFAKEHEYRRYHSRTTKKVEQLKLKNLRLRI